MSLFNRLLADSLIKPMAREPVLSVVVPTFNRPQELTLAVSSIADQVGADLDGKVEIIISDNASGPETRALLGELATRYACVNYYVHALNYGGEYQYASAPHKARGRWTWVFGDDDVLGPGLAAIVEVLEREEPGFLTLNRQVWNKTLDQCIANTRHDLPDMGFDTFLDLLALFGFDQLSFWSSQVYATDVARALDATVYVQSSCRYSHLAYYLEAFHDRPAYYLSLAAVRHRWDQGAADVHAANFHHLATLTPELVQQAADRVGLEPGLFERIGGRRSLMGPETRRITFVDNILQNLWRSVAIGTAIPETEWNMLQRLSGQWRPDHAHDLEEVRDAYGKVSRAFEHYQALVANHQACALPERAYSPDEVEVLQQSEAAIRVLQNNINEARKMAFEVAGRFG